MGRRRRPIVYNKTTGCIEQLSIFIVLKNFSYEPETIPASFLFFSHSFFCIAQTAPPIQWQINLGRADSATTIYGVQQTGDEGYILTGSILAPALDGSRGMIQKLKSDRSIEWVRYLGDYVGDLPSQGFPSVQQTSDGGYIAGGYAGWFGFSDSYDCWLVKLNTGGDVIWNKHFGGSGTEGIQSVIQTSDGGYIFAGSTASTNGDVTGAHGGYDCWIVKLNSLGVTEWKKCYGGSSNDYGAYIRQTNDGGYIVCGSSSSTDGDVMGYHVSAPGAWGNGDIWVIKLDTTGNIQWQKCLGGTDWDGGCRVHQIPSGQYMIYGQVKSADEDVSGNHGERDSWLAKLDTSGNLLWQKCYGGTSDEFASQFQQTPDGGFVLLASTISSDGDVVGNHYTGGSYDCWVVKTDPVGNIEWQKCLGGVSDEFAGDICTTSDGGYFIGGDASSCDGDLDTCFRIVFDAWVVKLGAKPVPLTLTFFTAQKQNKSVLLNWQTATEINTQHFIIEKSKNAVDFSSINTIAASGNSSATKNYSCTDASPFDGINYYRLKQVDKDGSFVYSKTIAVNFNAKGSVLYPNPATSVITVISSSAIKAITVMNTAGKAVQQLQPVANNQYNISNLPKGLYWLKLFYEQGYEVLQLNKN